MALKHVGRFKYNKKRVIVAYRTIPGDPYSALVVATESLPADEHDSLIKLVESAAGQEANELAEAMARTWFNDGRNILAGLHTTGRLRKVNTNEVEMVPDSKTTIGLDELNELIAKQKGVSIGDLAVKSSSEPEAVKKTESVAQNPVDAYTSSSMAAMDEAITTNEVVLDDDALAAQLRSQADAMFKEAKRLRDQADSLAPTKKKAKTAESA
jgi:hypothetical protein